MSRFLFFWVALIFYTGTRAQSLHFAEHSIEDHTQNLVCVNAKSYYLEGLYQGGGQHQCNLVGINQSGSLLFRTAMQSPVSGYLSEAPVKVLATAEKNLLVLYNVFQDGCDYGNFRNLCMALLDTLGNTLFTQALLSYTNNNHYQYQPFDGVQAKDSSYFLTVRNELYHYSKNGQFLGKNILPFFVINCLTALSNGKLLVNASQPGGFVNAELDTAGLVLASYPVTDSLRKIVESAQGPVYALGYNGKLLRYSPQYSVQASALLPGVTISDFEILQDTLYAVGYRNSPLDQPFYAMLDQNLQLIYSAVTSQKGIYPSGIAVNNKNRVNVAATGHNDFGPFVPVSQPEMGFRAYYQFGKSGTFMQGGDVGVISISPKDWLHISQQEYYLDAEVEVKNFGSQPVNGFSIHSKAWSSYCLNPYRRWIDSLLLPGQSLKIRTGMQALRGESFAGFYANNKRLICFYTSIPDSMADSNPDNDRYCDSMGVTPTGIWENSETEGVLVYPIPFAENLTINGKQAFLELRLMDLQGKLLHQVFPESPYWIMRTDELQAGMYLLYLRTEQGVGIRKVIRSAK